MASWLPVATWPSSARSKRCRWLPSVGYYTLYTRWLSDVENICDTLNELNIYSCRLSKHERLDENVYKVTYVNDTNSTKIEIVLNYQRINWTYENGIVIPAKSYKIV